VQINQRIFGLLSFRILTKAPIQSIPVQYISHLDKYRTVNHIYELSEGIK